MTIDTSDMPDDPVAQDASGSARRPEPERVSKPGSKPNSKQVLCAGQSAMASETQRRIGRNLRILYADVLDLPLPDRFETLLAELSGQPASRETS